MFTLANEGTRGTVIYHIFTKAQWGGLKGQTEYRPPSLAEEGLSTDRDRWSGCFGRPSASTKDSGDLRVLCVNPEKVASTVRKDEIDED